MKTKTVKLNLPVRSGSVLLVHPPAWDCAVLWKERRKGAGHKAGCGWCLGEATAPGLITSRQHDKGTRGEIQKVWPRSCGGGGAPHAALVGPPLSQLEKLTAIAFLLHVLALVFFSSRAAAIFQVTCFLKCVILHRP